MKYSYWIPLGTWMGFILGLFWIFKENIDAYKPFLFIWGLSLRPSLLQFGSHPKTLFATHSATPRRGTVIATNSKGCRIQLEDGTVGWCPISALSLQPGQGVTGSIQVGQPLTVFVQGVTEGKRGRAGMLLLKADPTQNSSSAMKKKAMFTLKKSASLKKLDMNYSNHTSHKIVTAPYPVTSQHPNQNLTKTCIISKIKDKKIHLKDMQNSDGPDMTYSQKYIPKDLVDQYEEGEKVRVTVGHPYTSKDGVSSVAAQLVNNEIRCKRMQMLLPQMLKQNLDDLNQLDLSQPQVCRVLQLDQNIVFAKIGCTQIVGIVPLSEFSIVPQVNTTILATISNIYKDQSSASVAAAKNLMEPDDKLESLNFVVLSTNYTQSIQNQEQLDNYECDDDIFLNSRTQTKDEVFEVNLAQRLGPQLYRILQKRRSRNMNTEETIFEKFFASFSQELMDLADVILDKKKRKKLTAADVKKYIDAISSQNNLIDSCDLNEIKYHLTKLYHYLNTCDLNYLSPQWQILQMLNGSPPIPLDLIKKAEDIDEEVRNIVISYFESFSNPFKKLNSLIQKQNMGIESQIIAANAFPFELKNPVPMPDKSKALQSFLLRSTKKHNSKHKNIATVLRQADQLNTEFEKYDSALKSALLNDADESASQSEMLDSGEIDLREIFPESKELRELGGKSPLRCNSASVITLPYPKTK